MGGNPVLAMLLPPVKMMGEAGSWKGSKDGTLIGWGWRPEFEELLLGCFGVGHRGRDRVVLGTGIRKGVRIGTELGWRS